ncbi:lytic transglycosylase domain-containing protein [Sphingomonas sp. ID1715]|nr:lytic transglycosylase domain-containing protein [Sphingomonas sp. ID1715]
MLVEHKAYEREFDEVRTKTSLRLWPPSSTVPSTVPNYRRPGSSPARDRVIIQITAAERRHGLPAGLLDALVAAESSYRSDAVSRAGAAGLAQLMPATARSLGVFDRFDIRANLDGGARYLRSMIDQFGSIAMALAAYNAGPGAVIRARGIPRNGETPDYVNRVIRHWRSLWR